MRIQATAKTGKVFAKVFARNSLLQCSLLLAVILVSCSAVTGSPAQRPESGLSVWLDQQLPQENDVLNPAEMEDGQGENEYLDAMLLREGLTGQVEPKKKPIQARSFYEGIRNRRRLTREDQERMFAKRDLNGMSMSITHNLDILRRGLLRELSLRQREQDRRHLMENNKKFLNGIGRRRRR